MAKTNKAVIVRVSKASYEGNKGNFSALDSDGNKGIFISKAIMDELGIKTEADTAKITPKAPLFAMVAEESFHMRDEEGEISTITPMVTRQSVTLLFKTAAELIASSNLGKHLEIDAIAETTEYAKSKTLTRVQMDALVAASV